MNTKEDLINNLIKEGYLKTPAVIEAFKNIDRKSFVSDDLQNRAYENSALPIGNKQTISQPLVVAFMLELLDLKFGEKVLEIGTGSGWKTGLMADLVGDGGKIFSIERVRELYDIAENNIQKYEAISNRRVDLLLGDGSKGYEEGSPYDKIISAASAEDIPLEWKDQLKIGGRIVAPVKDSILVLDKLAKNKFETKEYFGFNFVPLISH